ncbi:2-amino-4-hydroxy-6-hydroxymethyldihydropteridine diphosphokinase [Gleimia hominis]|uniref:Bifunctional folate synthesis protein n=1 Tax=Gleimia hominis TaxID=595468 RepID=A0ABU3I9K6_9ACTO|nr:2-amino-4-hydroxy-6-hydroxymethyldihydropteridine diphosphokinase [Gleimia hominis]MDT3767050.1 2-amino-4-hydroxy-6-hydroxymethyldihydropteridine diphosphokinase [Gleimia hominis]
MQRNGLDVITISGLRGHGRHGVYDFENERGQTFVADVSLYLDAASAAGGDALERSVDYSQVAVAVEHILTGPAVNLIETLAERIAQCALEFEAVQAVDVVVHKPQAPIDVPFADVTVRIHREKQGARASDGEVRANRIPARGAPISRSQRHKQHSRVQTSEDAFIALGANLDQPWRHLAQAVLALDQLEGVECTGVSGLFRTEPVLRADQAPQPDYYNAVVRVRTQLDPHDLLAALQYLEGQHGRAEKGGWQPRPLDLDIITYGQQQIDTPELQVPHPRAWDRAFVLAPLLQVDADAHLPGYGAARDLLAAIRDQEIELCADVWVEQAVAGHDFDTPSEHSAAPGARETVPSDVADSFEGVGPAEGNGRGSARGNHRPALRIVDDADELHRLDSDPVVRQRRTPRLETGLPEDYARGLLPVDGDVRARRTTTVRPTVTGAIPVQRQRGKR